MQELEQAPQLNKEKEENFENKFEHLDPEDRELVDKAVENLKDYDVPIDLPEDIRVFDEIKKGEEVKGHGTNGSYNPRSDRLIVYKGSIKQSAILEAFLDNNVDDKEGISKKEKKKIFKKLKAVKRKFKHITKYRNSDKLPGNVKKKAEKGTFIGLYEAINTMEEGDLKKVLGKDFNIDKDHLQDICADRTKETIEHELLHKLDMDIISGGEKDPVIEQRRDLEKYIKKYIEDIREFGSPLEEKETHKYLLQGGSDLEIQKKAMTIKKMSEEKYNKLIERANQKIKELDLDPDNPADDEEIIDIQLNLEDEIDKEYEKNKEEIDEYLKLLQKRIKKIKEEYPGELSEARNQIWTSFRQGELDSKEGVEKLKNRIKLYEEKKGYENIRRYTETFIDTYQNTKGNKKDKIKNVLFGAEDMIYQTLTEKIKQETLI